MRELITGMDQYFLDGYKKALEDVCKYINDETENEIFSLNKFGNKLQINLKERINRIGKDE